MLGKFTEISSKLSRIISLFVHRVLFQMRPDMLSSYMNTSC